MKMKGRSTRHYKVTKEDALVFEKRYVNGESLRSLAREAGVHHNSLTRAFKQYA